MKRIEKKPAGRAPAVGRLAKEDAQVLPTALIVGAVLLIFALAMVSMLATTIKLGHKVNAGTSSTLNADAVVSKGLNVLTQGNNWGSAPSLVLTPIVGYKGDRVYNDVPYAQYVVQINPGNLLSPPGDQAYERTVSVDLYTLSRNFATPTVNPTPWTYGGPLPPNNIGHRTLQAVLRRGSVSAALIAGGNINIGGHWRVYWGDVYDYKSVTTPLTTVVVDIGNQPLGPGYPAIHTQTGCISASGSCAGCSGTGTGTASQVCLVTDTGAANCKLYPNDPNMPPQPSVDLEGMKAKAKTVYAPGGVSSYETGYFYYSAAIAANNVPGSNSLSGGAAGTGQEHFHQYNSSTTFEISKNSPTQVDNVLSRMAQNLGYASSWRGADDLYVFVDTQDGLPLKSDLSNAVLGGMHGGSTDGYVDAKFATFQGTFILLGSFGAQGHSGINTVTMNPPSAAWCPTTTTDKPDFNGFVYIGGNMDTAGAPVYYGSVDVEGDCTGSGTPTLYYRSDFNYSLIQSGSIGVTKWQEVKYFPTPLP